MSACCGDEALPALQCADGEPWRSEGSLEKTHAIKNSVNGSWVVASVDATLREGVCTAASRSGGGMGREHVGQVMSCVEGGTEAARESSG